MVRLKAVRMRMAEDNERSRKRPYSVARSVMETPAAPAKVQVIQSSQKLLVCRLSFTVKDLDVVTTWGAGFAAALPARREEAAFSQACGALAK